MKILEFLQEDSGGFSASRLAFLLWIAGVLVVWLITSIKSSSLLEIPDSISTVIGILMTGKVVQKFGEKPPESAEDKSAENASNQSSKKPGTKSNNNEEEHAGE